jgi:hypothetical protein
VSKKSKEQLAERYQLKVAFNKRGEWDNAIKQADYYLKKNKCNNQIEEEEEAVKRNKLLLKKTVAAFAINDKVVEKILNILTPSHPPHTHSTNSTFYFY